MLFPFISALAEEAGEAAEAVEAAAEAAEETAAETKGLLENLAGNSQYFWIAFGVVIALAVILLVISLSRKKWTAKTVAFGALAIALSFALSYIRLFRMPQGGSVTPGSMLPIMLFSATFGVGPGLAVGVVYGLLQYLQGGWFANVWQVLLDYILAFAALGLAGLARQLPKTWGLYAAMIIAALGRALSATLAGIMFWNTAPWASLVYNGTYLIPEIIICMVLAFPIAKPVMKAMQDH
ncbi:MAG: energy-coupled thiamine transporter ThiT [Clostridiales bacterium]|nr:energy-coupled thiamine transporter ThiT [Clostridiales bacterium]